MKNSSKPLYICLLSRFSFKISRYKNVLRGLKKREREVVDGGEGWESVRVRGVRVGVRDTYK